MIAFIASVFFSANGLKRAALVTAPTPALSTTEKLKNCFIELARPL